MNIPQERYKQCFKEFKERIISHQVDQQKAIYGKGTV